ncbi:carbon-nitrogen family hydrolase [Heliorestis acidaminivorans]|uniref:Carbon-nitrogen family hydrolase n=1 Tax=Heliorestis acidaminivorans TaxID=553427 RepID=A0A6I0ETM6_9FIRM|nr:carbon-nitrogen family hydrolase [Heliorestis acidaminivorans]KAB2952510.1 carbon-nitrogen family hydrolase [Heliorestis acidaminivorans]
MKIGLLQFSVCRGELEKNETIIDAYMKEAGEMAPDVIVLPEMWTRGYDLENLHLHKDLEELNGERTAQKLKKWALETGAYIVGGSTALRKSNTKGFTNTMYVVNPQGEKILTYDKVHLFRLMQEDRYMVAGQEKGNFYIKEWPCGAIICYDLRFPEWVRQTILANQGQMLFVVAQWPQVRVAHWRTLLQARAIENQAYVIACNRNGADDDGTIFAGHSMVIDPWGEIVAQKGEDEGWLWVDIDPNKAVEVRKKIPIFADRRVELY